MNEQKRASTWQVSEREIENPFAPAIKTSPGTNGMGEAVALARKRCFKCGQEKPITEFYKHPMMADGHLGKCKECNKLDVRNNYRARKPRYQEYYKLRDQAGWRKQWRKDAQIRYRKTNPEKYRAHTIASDAIRDGKLIRQPCEKCGNLKSEAHHDDYSKPLEVRWLCFKHHREFHGQQVT